MFLTWAVRAAGEYKATLQKSHQSLFCCYVIAKYCPFYMGTLFWWWFLSSIIHRGRPCSISAPSVHRFCQTRAAEMAMLNGGVALQPPRLMVPFSHLPPVCSDVKMKHYFAFFSGCPWGVPLKTGHRSSWVRWGRSPDLCLLNCKLWCITGQSGANDFAYIKHLG